MPVQRNSLFGSVSTRTNRSPFSGCAGNSIPKSACAAFSRSRSATTASVWAGIVSPFLALPVGKYQAHRRRLRLLQYR